AAATETWMLTTSGAGWLSAAEDFFQRTGAIFRYGRHYWVSYIREEDAIYCPYPESFPHARLCAMDKARELVHWTKHEKRLNRDFQPSRYAEAGYAREELVAEFGAAYLCILLGITSQVSKRHAANVSRWLRTLQGNRRQHLLTAALDAQRAVDYLHRVQ